MRTNTRLLINSKRILFAVICLAMALCAALALGVASKHLPEKRDAGPDRATPLHRECAVPKSAPINARTGTEPLILQSGGDFDLSRNVIAGGGGSSSNGDFVMDGTVGQSAAGASMSNGDFSVMSGFWQPESEVSPTPTPTPTPGPVLVAAGAALVNESCPPTNGAIDPGESVNVMLLLTNSGTLSTSNLVATLQPTSNVLAPSGPQNYGAIPQSGTISRNFSFTANGNCGEAIMLTLRLQDGATDLGSANYTVRLGFAGDTNVCNTACAGAPRISTSALLSCSGTNIVAAITITNSGTAIASNVVLTTAKLAGISGTPLPQTIGSLARGAGVTVSVTVTGVPSGATTLQVGGTYDGGTFNSNRRVTPPSCQ